MHAAAHAPASAARVRATCTCEGAVKPQHGMPVSRAGAVSQIVSASRQHETPPLTRNKARPGERRVHSNGVACDGGAGTGQD